MKPRRISPAHRQLLTLFEGGATLLDLRQRPCAEALVRRGLLLKSPHADAYYTLTEAGRREVHGG